MVSAEHVIELLPAYALDCLDESDAIQVSEHLAVCASCRAELKTYQGIVDDLPLAVPRRAPRPELKSRLMQHVGKKSSPAPVLNPWQRILASFRSFSPAWGLTSLVLVVSLVASNLFLWQRVNNLEENNPGVFMTIPLQNEPAAPLATGLIVISSNGEHGTLVVDGLPPLDEAHQYQLWLTKDGTRESGGVFSVDSDGYGALWVYAHDPLASFTSFGVTIEPAGGSPAPTGAKVLGGDL